jgi:hypothetical protein
VESFSNDGCCIEKSNFDADQPNLDRVRQQPQLTRAEYIPQDSYKLGQYA